MAVNNVIRMLNLTRGLNTDGDVDSDSLADNFVSNNYIDGTFVSNNFFQDNSGGLAAVGANTFTSGSGNYTVPAGVNFLSGFVVGGGGGGGGHKQANFNGGGGGSAPVAHFMTSVTPGDTIAYSVGTGGVGSSNVTTNSNPSGGGTGNASNFGSYATSNGGTGGGFGGNVGAAGNATGNALTFVSAGQTPQKSITGQPGGLPAQQVVGLTSTFKSDGTPISFGSVSSVAGAGGEGGAGYNFSLLAEPGIDGAVVIVEFS